MNQSLVSYAVIGHPIKHSKSPAIHTLFAQQTGEPVHYTAIESPLEGFAQTVEKFRQQGGMGMNVTVPFKQQALQIADHLNPRAQMAQAANTLIFSAQGITADNTDGVGLLRDLQQRHQQQLADKHILVLGAGGAARGILEPLLQARPKRLVVANRSVEKAHQLANDFNPHKPLIHGCGFADIPLQAYDLIINATAASLQQQTLPIDTRLVGSHSCCYDLMYANQPTPFMRWAQTQNAATIVDGLGMLVEQAAESFYLWRGVYPETNTVYQKIRQEKPL
jgi:shikimate dehydrogenase